LVGAGGGAPIEANLRRGYRTAQDLHVVHHHSAAGAPGDVADVERGV
jgi:hypothetical protein